jgi:hypothetical protein
LAKVTGLGATVIIQDATPTPRTISNDIFDFSFATPRATQDITGVDKFAMETLLLLADFTVTLKGGFNSAANQSHDVFKTIPASTSPNRSVSIAPTSNNSTPILVVNCVLTDYTITRNNNGELTWSVPGKLADGNVPTWA